MHINIVEWLSGKKWAGVENMKFVGSREGEWLHADVVEEWAEWAKWALCWRVASNVWQVRLGWCRGDEEADNGE